MPKSLTVNINSKVKLKLTEYGVSVLEGKHDVLMKTLPGNLRHKFKLELNSDGEWEEQLWVVMNKLGPSMKCGGRQLVESNNIMIPLAQQDPE